MLLPPLLLCLAVALLLWTSAVRDLPDGVWAWSCAITLFVAFWDCRKTARENFENPIVAVAPLVSGWIFLRYGLGALGVYYWDQYTWTMPGLDRHWHIHGGRLNLNQACRLSMLAGIGFYLAFRISVRRLVQSLPDIGWVVDPARLRINTLIYLPIGLLITLVVAPRTPLSINFLVTLFGTVTYALLVMVGYWWFSSRGFTRTKWMLAAILACTIAAVLGLTTGQVGQVFVPFMMVFFGYAVARRRLPWAFLVATGIIAIGVIGPVLTAYKHVTYDIVTADSPVEDRLLYTQEYLSTIRPRGAIELSVQRFVGRLILIEFPAAFSLYYPDLFDYLHGKSFAIEFGSMVPRLLWPDKPDMNLEINRYSQGVGLIRAGGVTSAKFDAVAEYYANFGPLGVLLLSIVHGLYLKVLYEWLTTGFDWLTGISLHLLLFLLNFDFFGIGQVFVMHIKLIPVSIVVLYILGRQSARQAFLEESHYAKT